MYSKYLCVGPFNQFGVANDLDYAIEICEKRSKNRSYKWYVIGLDNSAYNKWVSTKRFNLDYSPVVWDKYGVAPTQYENEAKDYFVFKKHFGNDPIRG